MADNFAFNIDSKAKLKYVGLKKLIKLMRSIINLQFRSLFKKIFQISCKLLLFETKFDDVSSEAEHLWKLQTLRFLNNLAHFKFNRFCWNIAFNFSKEFLKRFELQTQCFIFMFIQIQLQFCLIWFRQKAFICHLYVIFSAAISSYSII